MCVLSPCGHGAGTHTVMGQVPILQVPIPLWVGMHMPVQTAWLHITCLGGVYHTSKFKNVTFDKVISRM